LVAVVIGSGKVLRNRMISNRRELRSSVRQLVDSLGTEEDAVAYQLKALGVRGMKKNAIGCAIARYLYAVLGVERDVVCITVSTTRVHIKRSRERIPVQVKLPGAVSRFISAFDAGNYPDLVQRPVAEASRSTD
jgi:hypothetical protein